jgi:hypothetical protein
LSILPGFAAVACLVAAFIALLRPDDGSARRERILAVIAAVAMVPSLEEPSSWPFVALVVGAAVFATPLPCLLGAAAAAMAALAAPAPESQAIGAPVLAALALAAGAASLGSEGAARLRSGADRAWPAVWAGIAFCIALAIRGAGQGLAGRFTLGAPEARAVIPGAGVLVGLALVATLAGSLALLTHLLTPKTPSEPVRRFGQGALVLGAGLGVLAVGFVGFRGSRFPEALATGAAGLAGLMLAVAGLVAALFVLIGPPPSGEAARWARQAGLEATIGSGLSVGAAGAAGLEGWLRLGTYATPLTAAAASAALLALAVREPTKLGLAKKALWLLALAFVVAA